MRTTLFTAPIHYPVTAGNNRKGQRSKHSPQPPKSPGQRAILDALQLQLNTALNQVGELKGQVAQLEHENKALTRLQRVQERAIMKQDKDRDGMPNVVNYMAEQNRVLDERCRTVKQQLSAMDKAHKSLHNLYAGTVQHLRALQSLSTTSSLYQVNEFVTSMQSWLVRNKTYTAALESTVRDLEKRCEQTESKLEMLQTAQNETLTRRGSKLRKSQIPVKSSRPTTIIESLQRPGQPPEPPAGLGQLSSVSHPTQIIPNNHSADNEVESESQAHRENTSRQEVLDSSTVIMSPIMPQRKDKQPTEQKSQPQQPAKATAAEVKVLPQTSVLKPNLKPQGPLAGETVNEPAPIIAESGVIPAATATPPPEKSSTPSLFKPNFLFKKGNAESSSPAKLSATPTPPAEGQLENNNSNISTSVAPTVETTVDKKPAEQQRRVFGGRRNQPQTQAAVDAPRLDEVEEIALE